MPTSPLEPHTATPAELRERLAADRAGRPYLLFRDGDRSQRILTLAGDRRLTIGRAPECEVALSWDASASRAHAQLEPIGGGWAIIDDGLSRHGSFVNGERVLARRRLADGDVVAIGDTMLVFRAPLEDAEETVPPGSAVGELVLTPAQRRVLVALCRPYLEGTPGATPATNQRIADELTLSVAAVKTHLRALYDALEVEELQRNVKRARLAQIALEAGLVSARDLPG